MLIKKKRAGFKRIRIRSGENFCSRCYSYSRIVHYCLEPGYNENLCHSINNSIRNYKYINASEKKTWS